MSVRLLPVTTTKNS
jgi:hypothetical protein